MIPGWSEQCVWALDKFNLIWQNDLHPGLDDWCYTLCCAENSELSVSSWCPGTLPSLLICNSERISIRLRRITTNESGVGSQLIPVGFRNPTSCPIHTSTVMHVWAPLHTDKAEEERTFQAERWHWVNPNSNSKDTGPIPKQGWTNSTFVPRVICTRLRRLAISEPGR